MVSTFCIRLCKYTVPIGSRFDNKTDNWKDAEVLLGDLQADDDPSTVGGFDDCFGMKFHVGYWSSVDRRRQSRIYCKSLWSVVKSYAPLRPLSHIHF